MNAESSGGPVRRFAANTSGRDFVVGDIHGYPQALRELLTRVQFDPERDRVFSVGDLIDRGPDSLGALSLLDEPWFHAVQGNHEQMMAGVLTGQMRLEGWIANGGRWVLDADRAALPDLVVKVMDLPLIIVVGEGEGRFNVLHAETYLKDAEIDAGEISDHETQRILWGRSIISGQASGYTFSNPLLSKTYVGHTIRMSVQSIGQHVYIDTGCGMAREGARLTMIEPATGKTWSTGTFAGFDS